MREYTVTAGIYLTCDITFDAESEKDAEDYVKTHKFFINNNDCVVKITDEDVSIHSSIETPLKTRTCPYCGNTNTERNCRVWCKTYMSDENDCEFRCDSPDKSNKWFCYKCQKTFE